MTNSTHTNDINMGSVTGNLQADPRGPFTAPTGRIYWSFPLAINRCSKKDLNAVWKIKVFCFEGTESIVQSLKSGDWITIGESILQPGSIQGQWYDTKEEDKEKRWKNQKDGLLVFPKIKKGEGTLIPIEVKSRKSSKAIKQENVKAESIVAEIPTKKRTTKKKAPAKKKAATKKKPAVTPQKDLPLGEVTEDMVLATIS